jgi:hypothetical protein
LHTSFADVGVRLHNEHVIALTDAIERERHANATEKYARVVARTCDGRVNDRSVVCRVLLVFDAALGVADGVPTW